MLPFIVVMVPLYLVMRKLGLLDTRLALILTQTGATLPYVIWLLLEFFREIPLDIEDAAWIDGCSKLGTLWKIVLPLATPGVAAAAILITITIWNDFLIGLILTVTPRSQIGTVAITQLITDRVILWGELSAAAVTFVSPMIVFSLFGQKYLLKGLAPSKSLM